MYWQNLDHSIDGVLIESRLQTLSILNTAVSQLWSGLLSTLAKTLPKTRSRLTILCQNSATTLAKTLSVPWHNSCQKDS